MTQTQTLMDVPSTFRSLYVPVAIVLALLLGLLWLLGYGPGSTACRAPLTATVPAAVPQPAPVPAPAPAPTPTPAPVAAAPLVPAAPATATAATPSAAAVAVPPAAKIYFDTSKTDVNPGERAKMDGIIAFLKAHGGAKAVLSGFHDPRGDKASNEELALNRARAVRSVLEGQGIANDRVVMAKPVETTGDGNLQEARRVELSVQP